MPLVAASIKFLSWLHITLKILCRKIKGNIGCKLALSQSGCIGCIFPSPCSFFSPEWAGPLRQCGQIVIGPLIGCLRSVQAVAPVLGKSHCDSFHRGFWASHIARARLNSRSSPFWSSLGFRAICFDCHGRLVLFRNGFRHHWNWLRRWGWGWTYWTKGWPSFKGISCVRFGVIVNSFVVDALRTWTCFIIPSRVQVVDRTGDSWTRIGVQQSVLAIRIWVGRLYIGFHLSWVCSWGTLLSFAPDKQSNSDSQANEQA